jgi:Arylsulfotransferase (ASST)
MKPRTVSASVLVSLSAASALAPLSCDAPATRAPSVGGDLEPGAGGFGGPGGQPGGAALGGGAGVPIDASGGGPAVLPFAGEAMPGYTLIASPENDAGPDYNAFLIDMDGNRVHDWGITGFPPKMFPGGSLLGCTGVVPLGAYDCAQMVYQEWDGSPIWTFDDFLASGDASYARHHHDFIREGSPTGYFAPGQWPALNGRTFVLAMRSRTLPELRTDAFVEDVVYELDDRGQFVDIVWSSADHWQEFGFDAKALADIRARSSGIELLHGNLIARVGPNPWYRAGHQEFHPDNLIYSSRMGTFVVIISRETGRVVWRIGPDFDRGPEASLGQFAGQHFPHIIPEGLPGAGNMLVLDNGGAAGYGGTPSDPNAPRYARGYSRVVEFNPVTMELVWEYGSPSGPDSFYTPILGAVQRLPNGNTLITVGVPGRVIEVTPQKALVWSYQYEDPNDPKGWIYRAIRMPPEWLPTGANESLANYPSWGEVFGFGGSQQ